MEVWKAVAERMFLEEHRKIIEISAALGITRKYISMHLQTVPGYEQEKENRKAQNQKKRKESQREWDRKNRPVRQQTGELDRAVLMRDHIQAVQELSHEKYH